MNNRTAVAAIAVIALAAAAFIRVQPMRPAAWHIAPDAGMRSDKPNAWLIGEGGDAPSRHSPDGPAATLARLDGVAMAEPGTARLAGSPDAGLVTYVQRSRIMGYPDAVSIRAVAADGGSAVSLWSRSRYGYSDMGVNRARAERWLAAAGL